MNIGPLLRMRVRALVRTLVRLDNTSTDASTNVSAGDSTDELQQIFKSWE